jgi:hypothetical protein
LYSPDGGSKSSDNPASADNQQERLLSSVTSYDPKRVPAHIGYYLAGFADGEGSFNLSFRKRKDYEMPWKISLCFNVSQKDKVILALFKRHLRCGTLRSRSDGIWYYEVNNFTAIIDHVIPFFNRFRFLSAKKKHDFSRFKTLAGMIGRGEHLTEPGIRRILELRKDMNGGGAGRRKYSDEEILAVFHSGESSETIRQATPPEGG